MRAFRKRSQTALAFLLLGTVLAQDGRKPSGGASSPPAQQTAQISSGSRIQPLRPGFRLPFGETLHYDGEWRFVPGGVATLRVDQAGGQNHITGTADSTGVVNLLYPIQERFNAYLDAKNLCSNKVIKHSEEGSRKRETLVTYDYGRGKAVLDERNLKDGQQKKVENDIPACVTDIVSGIFYVASLPLQQGATYSFPINDGGKTVNAQAHVEGREEIKTPAGTFKTVRVAPEGDSGPLLKNKGRVWLWYTDDERHLPIQMRAKLLWGTVTIYLSSITK